MIYYAQKIAPQLLRGHMRNNYQNETEKKKLPALILLAPFCKHLDGRITQFFHLHPLTLRQN
jgi:hypothetical protein